MDSLIVEDLGKRYFMPSKRPAAEPRRTLNLGVARMPLPRLRLPGGTGLGRDLWALRHVSFAVQPGTVLGIIGPNGAGKSTLMKIIARVTRPTEGRVVGVGRVVSLLELGAGFNPDFSARENVLMNAAMHGIRRREALDRIEEIVRFAELGDFLDNPLRQYSSGMYLRLAFSVAINMQPDILVADEILAVGDIAFQERCLQRVAEEAERGLTVLFVSHDLSAVTRLCHRVIWLDRGQVRNDGEPESVAGAYQEAALLGTSRARAADEKAGRHMNHVAEIASVRLLNAAGEEIGAAPTTEDVYVRVRLKVRKPGTAIRGVVNLYGRDIFLFRTVQPDELVADHRGIVDLMVRFPAHLLTETAYSVNVTVYTRLGKEQKVVLDNALAFLAYGEQIDEQFRSRVRPGLIAPRLEWSAKSHLNVRRQRKSLA